MGGDTQCDGLRMFAQGGVADGAVDAGDLVGGMAKGRKARPEPRPFGRGADQPAAGKPVGQQAVAQFKVKSMREGNDQVFGVPWRKGDGGGRIGGGQAA